MLFRDRQPTFVFRLSKSLWKTAKRRNHYACSQRLKPYCKPHTLLLCQNHCEIPIPCYGGRYMAAMISGTGPGSQLMAYVQNVFRHATIPVDFEHIKINSTDDVENATTAIKRNGTALKSDIEQIAMGAIDSTLNIAIKQNLDVYLNIIHWKPYPGIAAKFKDVDVVLIRQNMEGEFAMLEHEDAKGVVECLKIITRSNTERIARTAFEFATEHNRKRITVVHKANIMQLSDGLFLSTIRGIAKEYPNIKQDDVIVDNCCMQLVADPKRFDILLTPNLYGSIVSSVISGLLGGPGLYASYNYGKYYAIFEPVSREADIVGKDVVNPIAMLTASLGLLYYLNLRNHAHLLKKAIFKTITEDHVRTSDIGGTSTSNEVVEKIKDNITYFQKHHKQKISLCS